MHLKEDWPSQFSQVLPKVKLILRERLHHLIKAIGTTSMIKQVPIVAICLLLAGIMAPNTAGIGEELCKQV